MVKEIMDTPATSGKRRITFEYVPENPSDIAIIAQFGVICGKQPNCVNCTHFYQEGCFGGYMACACDIHGNIEALDNLHHDMDGSRCPDYCKRKENKSS